MLNFSPAIPVYPICIFLSLVLGLLVLALNLRPLSLSRTHKLSFLTLSLALIIICAKFFTLLSALLHGLPGHSHATSFAFLELGLSSYGAALGLLLSALLFSSFIARPLVSFRSLLPAILPVALLMYSVGKIGCFLVGCCYGMEYSGPFAIVYSHSPSAPVGVSLFPVQILETISFFLLFLYFEHSYLRLFSPAHPASRAHTSTAHPSPSTATRFSAHLILVAALAKFLLDFFRTGHSYSSLASLFSLNQLVSLALILASVVILTKTPLKPPRPHSSRSNQPS